MGHWFKSDLKHYCMLFKFISQLRNAQMAYHRSVLFKDIGFCIKILNILWNKGLIRGYAFIDNSTVEVFISYQEGVPLLKRLVVLSKRSMPVYINRVDLLKLSKLTGIVIVSTTNGIMSAEEAIRLGYGGKALAYFE